MWGEWDVTKEEEWDRTEEAGSRKAGDDRRVETTLRAFLLTIPLIMTALRTQHAHSARGDKVLPDLRRNLRSA